MWMVFYMAFTNSITPVKKVDWEVPRTMRLWLAVEQLQ
jgi:hypothetical protein